MIKSLTSKIYTYLFQKEVLTDKNEDEIAWIKYGIELTISTATSFFLLLIAAVLLQNLYCALAFLIVFVPTRQFVGGYHADTYFKCNSVFLSSYMVVQLICSSLYKFFSPTLCGILLLVEVIIIAIISPIENKHKPINTPKQYIKCKCIGSSFYFAFGTLSILLIMLNKKIGVMIFLTLNLILLLGVLGILKERRYKNENKQEEDGEHDGKHSYEYGK